MKTNKLTIVLFIIILSLIGYIIYDKVLEENNNNTSNNEEITLIDNINLDYANIYITSDGLGYICPINEEKIDKLNVGSNLKERLNTLYTRAFYFDIYLDNYKLKGFKVKLDDEIKSIKKVIVDDLIYIVFIKENNKIGLFNYEEYYDLLNTKVIDNYNNINNVSDIDDNKIIYLDGSSKEFKIK